MATKVQNNENESLYVSMESFKEKRRSLLFSLRDSLVLQEEHEKIMKIREEKEEIMKKIKKDISGLDQLYQKLKRSLPSVKGAIINTEKELSELDKQFTTLTSDKKEEIIPPRETKNIKKRKDEISTSKPLNKQQKEVAGYVSEKASHKINNDITKLDRIKHNLKVIETKLKKS